MSVSPCREAQLLPGGQHGRYVSIFHSRKEREKIQNNSYINTYYIYCRHTDRVHIHSYIPTLSEHESCSAVVEAPDAVGLIGLDRMLPQ